MIKTTITTLLLSAASLSAFAQMSPVGLWKTIDDETSKEKSLVRIADTGGVLSGKIEKITDPAKAANLCDKCSDERKDKPIQGMTILRGIKPSSDAGVWEGGDILDPNNGKLYKVRIKPVDGGKQLEVRGFMGISLLGRTQTWIRVE